NHALAASRATRQSEQATCGADTLDRESRGNYRSYRGPRGSTRKRRDAPGAGKARQRKGTPPMNVLLRRLALFVALLLVVAAGVAAVATRLPADDLAPLQAASASAQGFSGPADTSFDAITRRMTQLRGLTPRRDVPQVALTPQQYRDRMIADMAEEDSLKSIDDSRQLMVALGLLAPDVD